MEPSRRSARARYSAETLILAVTMSQHAKRRWWAGRRSCSSTGSAENAAGTGYRAQNARSADGRWPRARPGLGQFGGEGAHQVLGLGGEDEADAHSRTDCASIASAARRYSPASQSLAR